MKRSLKILALLALAFPAMVAAQDDKKIAAQKKVDQQNTGVDWPKLLADLRSRFASAPEAVLQQTRIDRAFFKVNEDDPDQPPFLHFKGVCLRTALDDDKKMKDVLLRELQKFTIPGAKFVVKVDDIQFHDSPIYALQEAAVAAFKANATFNVFFERATYAADGRLQVHVLCLRFDASTDAKLAKLLDENPPAKDLILLPDGKTTKAPAIQRRDYDWLGRRLALQREFAGGADLLLQRTRLDDGFLHYSKDRKAIQFHSSGVCIDPPALVAAAERDKRWKAKVSGLFPKVVYEPSVTDIAMAPNPSMAWQNRTSDDEANDGVFFHLAAFDADGRIHADVQLPTKERRDAALKAVQDEKIPAVLGAVGEKNLAFTPWNWAAVKPRGQGRLAAGDFLQHRTRLDRVFLRYDDAARGRPAVHLGGVSLHPTEVEPADQLRKRLEQSLGGLLPTDLTHDWNSQRLQFLSSPIYDMQAKAVADKLDGMLFADGRYDAEGNLHFIVAIGAPAQKAAATTITQKTPFPNGMLRGKEQAKLDFIELAWEEFLNEVQHWMARSSDSLLRKSRLDRGYFSYPASKVGPVLNLAFLGIYPQKPSHAARLKSHLGRYADIALRDQLRAGPIAAAPIVQNIDNPATTVQTKVPEQPILDGVRLDDASFDKSKKLILHGIWTGKEQQDPLERLIRDTLTPGHPALQHGINWSALQAYDIAGLLLSMRTWVAGQEKIDEVWLERIYFDAAGAVRVAGFFTRPPDRDRAVRKLADMLPIFESKKLPAIQEDAEEKAPPKKGVVPVAFVQQPKDAGPFKLDQLPNIGQHLRDNIPKNTKCDGLRIDRCFYDAKGVLRIDGLADHLAHTQELQPFFDDDVPFDRKRQLAKGWGEGRQTVIRLHPMMVSLAENLPSLGEFDGLVLSRAHHDAANRLVLSGNAVGEHDPKQLAATLKRLLDTHPRWQIRTTSGVVLNITDKRAADRELAKRLTYRALHLLQVNIGEARVEPAYPTKLGWWSHAWPFDEKLPRVRPTDEDYDDVLDYTEVALRHDPRNVLTWYLRGYALQAKNRSDLTLRDFRRLAAIETDDPVLRHDRIINLELVQGRLRQSAFNIEQRAIVENADGWTLRILRESPAARDPGK